MKLYRNAAILVVVLGLLVGAYYIANNIKNKNASQNKNNSSNVLKIVDADREKISGLTIVNSDGTFVITREDQDFILKSPSDFKASSDSISSIISNITYLVADKVVEENAKDMAQYGLDKPETITLKYTDGKTQIIELGNLTSTSSGYYMKEKGKTKIYILGSYTGEKLIVTRNALKDKTLFDAKEEDINSFRMDKGGKVFFAAKKNENKTWLLTAPIDGNVDYTSISPMVQALLATTVKDYVEENPADLSKYGLATPVYSFEFTTAKKRVKILMGAEKVKDSERYAMMEGGKDVFTFDETAYTFLDKPLKEIIEVFAYIVDIYNVNKIVAEIDGRKDVSEIKAFSDSSDKDKFVFNGKDANGEDKDGNEPFKAYYRGLIGITLTDIEMGSVPVGKPEITFTYYLKKAPGIVKVEFIPKNEYYYYVVKNGKYSNIIVAKSKFDEPEGPRDAYKKLIEFLKEKK